MAILKDIEDEFYLGEDWLITFSLNDENGDDLDLTGGTVEFRIQKGQVDNKYTDSDKITITDAATGDGYLSIRPADQSVFTAGVWNYEIWCQLADDTSSIQAKGTLTISKSLKQSFP